MEVVIDYEYLTGARGETVLKEVSVAAENVKIHSVFYPHTPRIPIVPLRPVYPGKMA